MKYDTAPLSYIYTAKNAQVAVSRSVAGLITGRNQANTRMHCSNLVTTSLLQVVNQLDASCF